LVVGTVGANSRRKRFDILLTAFAAVHEAMPEAVLVIKTDVAVKPLGFDIPAMARALGLGAAVIPQTGELTDPEMADLYRAMDVYVHTAEWEGFGIPVVEAMACGLPVVSSPIQGPAEILPYPDMLVREADVVHEGGTVLRWADPTACADRILEVCREPGVRRRMAAAGRREAETHYDIGLVAESWEAVIEEYAP
jgi:phosphatidylinositol alpha-1,6-mannosyltransferase